MPHTIRNIQSPYVEADFWTQYESTTPRMALFILITPQSFWSGVSPIGLTSNSRDMTLPGHPGITFKSKPGITQTEVEHTLGEPSNMEITGLYQSDSFNRADVIAGKWNFATMEIFVASWDNVNLGEKVEQTGNVGEFKDFQTFFTGECRGLLARLSADTSIATQRLCRVKEFRDSQCRHTSSTVVIGGITYNTTQTGQVEYSGGADFSVVVASAGWSGNIPPNNISLFQNGKVTCVTGVNAGVSREIAAYGYSSFDGTITFTLKRKFPFAVTGGDTYNLVAGCTRTLEDCRKYSNAANFAGESWIPGIEVANRVASSN